MTGDHTVLAQGKHTVHLAPAAVACTDLLEHILFGVTFGPRVQGGRCPLTVAGDGGPALWAVQQVIPQHILGLRVVAGALRVSS